MLPTMFVNALQQLMLALELRTPVIVALANVGQQLLVVIQEKLANLVLVNAGRHQLALDPPLLLIAIQPIIFVNAQRQ